jgi:hypothetical protein
VDEPRAAHRLDDSADRFAVDRVDPPRQRSQRVNIRRDDEPIELLTPLAEQPDVDLSPTEVSSSVQHLKRAPSLPPR